MSTDIKKDWLSATFCSLFGKKEKFSGVGFKEALLVEAFLAALVLFS